MERMILRVCKHCQEGKTYEELVKDKRKTDGVISVCKECGKKQLLSRPNYIALKEEMKRKYREEPTYAESKRKSRQLYHKNYLERVLLSNAKTRAKRMNLLINIDEFDIVIPEVCPLLEIPIFRGTNEVKSNSPSLDRIDTTKGYIKGNVRVISYKANTMKNDGDIPTLKMFIRNLERYLGNDIV